jgi:hypothetical protein
MHKGRALTSVAVTVLMVVVSAAVAGAAIQPSKRYAVELPGSGYETKRLLSVGRCRCRLGEARGRTRPARPRRRRRQSGRMGDERHHRHLGPLRRSQPDLRRPGASADRAAGTNTVEDGQLLLLLPADDDDDDDDDDDEATMTELPGDGAGRTGAGQRRPPRVHGVVVAAGPSGRAGSAGCALEGCGGSQITSSAGGTMRGRSWACGTAAPPMRIPMTRTQSTATSRAHSG